MPPSPPSLLFMALLLLSSTPSYSFSFLFSNYHTLFSLSHSLITRVANLRAARGDLEGAGRARGLARNLERAMGLGFYRFAWSAGRDYVKNYAWGDTVSFETIGGLVSDLSELMGAFGELNRIHSEAERVAWIGRNYRRAVRVSNSVFSRLVKVFRQPGPVREVVMALQKEVVEGDLVRDCIELGSEDLKALIQIVKDLALQYSHRNPETEL